MIIRIGYTPYLNMVPFHQGFGPAPLELRGRTFEFRTLSPRALGIEAEKGTIDAGALSLVDFQKLFTHFEPLGTFGIGTKRAARSVLLFSKVPLANLSGICAVTDETSTSFRLLQVLMEKCYHRTGVSYGRIASPMLYDGSAQALLLIGDEALRAKAEGVRGLPLVIDLGEEWYRWQGMPFVFARWAVRRGLRQEVKDIIELSLENSLKSTENDIVNITSAESLSRPFPGAMVQDYLESFVYRLTPNHLKAIEVFQELTTAHV